MWEFLARYAPIGLWGGSLPLPPVWLFHSSDFLLLWKENEGDPLILQCIVSPEILGVIRRIRRYVLKDAKEAWRLKESYRDTLAMEAVASAIIAQIAITMLSLSNFDSVHWAATALAYSSLICGITSTFYAFIVQELLSDLHSPEDVRAWLTTTRHSRSWPSRVFFGPERATNAQDRIPSIASAMTLTMPSKLLRMAVFALFVALGIYLGSVYQSGLGNLEGRGANMWVLIFFIVVLSLALVSSFVPMAASDSGDEAMSTDEELQNSRDGAPTRRQEPGNVIRDALESSIRAQEESLKAQKVLLDLLNARPPGLESTLATIASN